MCHNSDKVRGQQCHCVAIVQLCCVQLCSAGISGLVGERFEKINVQLILIAVFSSTLSLTLSLSLPPQRKRQSYQTERSR